jgi:hypothetical protein
MGFWILLKVEPIGCVDGYGVCVLEREESQGCYGEFSSETWLHGVAVDCGGS